MARLLVIAALVVLAYYMITGRWPWQARVGRKQRALANARRVLGVAPGAGRSDILAAHRRRLAEVHPDRGGSSASVHSANEARDLLLAELPASPSSTPHEP